MPIRTAHTSWTGGLTDGTGRTELTSSGLGGFDVSWPKRTDDANDGTATTPEELVAAAHASCFSMALSHEIALAGGTPVSLDTRADVTFGPDPAGGFMISGIAITVRGVVENLDQDGFLGAAEAAKVGCPVSKALGGTEITLDAALA
jgi:osmotically inducible protein OsmC